VEKERRLEELEALLILTGAIHPPDRLPPAEKSRNAQEEEEDFSDDDPSSRIRSSVASTNGRPAKNVRASVQDDDSDFDL